MHASFRAAICFIELKRYSDAIAQLQKTETLFPDFPNKDWLLFFTGLSYVELKQPQFAKQYLQRLIAQYPNSSLRKAAE